jgi:hypothetical protein
MSQYLKNIIARHSAHELGPVVAPRRRSRFETNQGSGPSPLWADTGIHTTTPADTGLHTDLATPLSLREKNPELQSITGRLRNYVTHEQSIQAENSALNSSAQESPGLRVADRPNPARKVPSAGPPILETVNGDRLTVTSELKHRIESILHHLETAQARSPALQPVDASSPTHFMVSPSGNSPGSPGILPAFPESVMAGHTEVEHPSKPPALADTGLLQTPAWVDELQIGLQNRFRETTAQNNAEPSVNVTIGRIEIRASRDKGRKRPQTRDKTGGVMSLDDYLEQRDGSRN